MRKVTALTLMLAVIFTAGSSAAALITQLTSPAQFVSTTTFSNDFDSGTKDTAQFSFDSDASIFSAVVSVSGVTSSGAFVLVRSTGFGTQLPLNAFLTVDAFEVGMFFGNDIGYFGPVLLSVFDSLNTLLGSVTVNGNGNDFADQFIGLRSDTAFRSVSIDYTGNANLARVIDDFTIGISIPEPATITLFALGLAALGFMSRRRRRGAAA